jgi:hypothetical protein
LRFNRPDSAYLNRTPSSAGNRNTWTFSTWIKRSALGGAGNNFYGMFGASTGANTFTGLYFNNGTLWLYAYTNGTENYAFNTTQVFRDPSAWYHIVVAVDTTQATNTNRVKIYVNGSQITAFAYTVYPTQNFNDYIDNNIAHTLGWTDGGTGYYDGYMTETYLIDGQQLTPSSFGETSATTGVWQPKKFTGTYGTNGFYVNFSDNSNTTSATLGKDSSGNGNNWTPNNFSVTAGAGNDSFVDSPTSYGSDSGVGGEVRGNYSTFNPLALGSSTSDFSNGNLNITTPASGVGNTVSTIQVPNSGQYYCEITFVTDSAGAQIGIVDFATINANMPLSSNCVTYASSGVKYVDGTSSSYGSSYTTGDIIGLAINADTGSITFYKNNTSQGAITHAVAGLVIGVCDGSNSSGGSVFTGNFGQRAFAYTAPSGYKALCTQNLPTPTIGATSATLANTFFTPVTYTGTGASLGVTGVGFQPDWTWIKSRSNALSHGLYDAVRGVQKQLISDSTATETTETTGLTAFGSDGFTVGALAQLNTSAATYVAWNWKANGAGSSNTSGSITSTVSANTTSGFSVVTYTGTGANATVGHGLGVAPSVLIVKSRSASGGWPFYNKILGGTKVMEINSTAAASTSATSWNNTDPTSTVFTIGTSTGTNASGTTFVAYCFATIEGYSAFGSYTGNGSTDGPFVYCGFRPAYVMIKNTAGTSDWDVFDNKRSGYNVKNDALYANATYAEDSGATYTYLDLTSNGFKIRSSAFNNTSANSYIFMAFAENPFKYSLAR